MEAITPVSPDTSGAAHRDLITGEANSELFLQLLVAQMRTQDPLEPQDPTTFVTQLATFSSLEQQLGMRKSLEAIELALQPPPEDAALPDPAL